MGLDMYVYMTSTDIPQVDFAEPADGCELFYWREHPNLEAWMERLYRSKNGKRDRFNCAPVRIDLTDLDALELAVKSDALPISGVRFSRVSRPVHKVQDFEFIHFARMALAYGEKIYYISSW